MSMVQAPIDTIPGGAGLFCPRIVAKKKKKGLPNGNPFLLGQDAVPASAPARQKL
jgi:hypothetical protein